MDASKEKTIKYCFILLTHFSYLLQPKQTLTLFRAFLNNFINAVTWDSISSNKNRLTERDGLR